jgi:pyruvate dehydrogenase E2 component (dihydrolipoyllysine-residue acetyltransferase)
VAEAAPAAAPAPVSDATPTAAATPAPAPSGAPGAPAPANAANGAGGRLFASPLARRLAKEAGLELAAIAGSGPHGRIIKADVENAKATGVAAPAATSGAPSGAASGLANGMGAAEVRALYEEGSYEAVKNDGMRKIVAARLTEAKQTIPHFYLNIDCKIDALLAARADINAAAQNDESGKPEYKISVNDFIVKAWALALQAKPLANATWAGDAILYHKHSDVAVAVAVPGGLFTPVVRGAEAKSLREISAEVRDYAKRAKTRKLAPHEYQGGATAISNLGMYGISEFAAVINPPHGTILAVGAGQERVFAQGGEVKTGHFMTVTLSCDHRSVDGALGAELLGAFKKLIEQPVMMLA